VDRIKTSKLGRWGPCLGSITPESRFISRFPTPEKTEKAEHRRQSNAAARYAYPPGHQPATSTLKYLSEFEMSGIGVS
jgi:hypothetical protein